jgi:hypothetical protein
MNNTLLAENGDIGRPRRTGRPTARKGFQSLCYFTEIIFYNAEGNCNLNRTRRGN